MAMFDAFNKFYFWVFNIPYYSIIVTSNGEKLKTIIQKVTDGKSGADIAIIDRKLKKAWTKETIYKDGKKFIGVVNIHNAIALTEIPVIELKGDILVKETTTKKLKSQLIDFTKDGTPMKLEEKDYFPSTILFEKLDGHFVKQTIAKPPNAWEEKKWAIIGVAICIVVIIYFVLSSGVLNRGVG
jgi:hypothetical protein